MKKLLVALTVVAFLVGSAVPALGAYHQVYKAQFDATTGAFTGWALTMDCEMFSEDSATQEYKWQSAEGIGPGSPDYAEPTRQPAPKYQIRNDVHVFPWVKTHISESHLTWDVFAPGDYMAKTSIISLQANCCIQIHLGGGRITLPGTFVGGKTNGHITPITYGLLGANNMIGNKPRISGLMLDSTGAVKNVEGSPPDAIEVRYWWYVVYDDVSPSETHISTDEFAMMPATKAEWDPAESLNCTKIVIPDSEALHEENRTHFVLFEDLLVEPCDSEGKYQDIFAVTITPDP